MKGENGVPETPDWHVEPRPAPVYELVQRVARREFSIPDNITLGSE